MATNPTPISTTKICPTCTFHPVTFMSPIFNPLPSTNITPNNIAPTPTSTTTFNPITNIAPPNIASTPTPTSITNFCYTNIAPNPTPTSTPNLCFF